MNNIETLTVYLGSSGHAREIFKNAATDLGVLIAQNNKRLIYGGMDAGLMGILAKNTLKAGGAVTGIIPQKIKDSERMLPELTETILVEELCDRKKRMFLAADAILALPGGFGTLDEALEVLYWGGLGLHNKPLVLINIEGYWDPLIAYLKTLHDFDPRYLIITEGLDDIFPQLKNWSAPEIDETPHDHYPHFEDEICRNTDQPILIDKASIENTYMAICALGLKQLGKHVRAIGFLNTEEQFKDLEEWIQRAAKETFITPKCLKLYEISGDEETLRQKLKDQEPVEINLHKEKWGDAN